MDELFERAAQVGGELRRRGDSIAVSESAAGGLISAALLAVPGASAYYVGGTVIYTMAASKALLRGELAVPEGMRGATEDFARWQAGSVRARLDTIWALAETGAAGPAPNSYGDPVGHSWAAVDGPTTATRRTLTGLTDRRANMERFALAAVDLLGETLSTAG